MKSVNVILSKILCRMASAKLGSVMFFTICKTVLQQITHMNFKAFDSKTNTWGEAILQYFNNLVHSSGL